MRKLIFSINVTLDGCYDHTKGIASEDIHDYFTKLVQEAGLLVYGRKTYELMVPFWPDMAKNNSATTRSMKDFAEAFDAADKILVSRTIKDVDDKKTRIINSNLHDEILKLKQQEGEFIMLGGVDMPAQLIEAGLVDEFIIVVQPVISGGGKCLSEKINLQEQMRLKLVESKALASGAVVLHYAKQ